MPATVLITLMGLEIGGAETHAVVLARHLQEMGYRVVMASSGGRYEAEIARLGIPHYTLPLDQSRFSAMWPSIRTLRRILYKEKIDLIHAHARIPAFVCDLARFGTGIPLLTTAHARFKSPLHLRYLSRWGEEVIVVSPDIQAHLSENYRVPQTKMHLIYNGIDVETFNPASANEPNEPNEPNESEGMPPVRLLYLSRLDPALTPVALNLIEAVRRLYPAHPGLHLDIAGEGPGREAILARIQALVTESTPCAKNLRFLGALPQVHKTMLKCDLVIGVSRVALEAMACGRHVILAGGEGFEGLLRSENLDRYARDNFTGRQSGKRSTVEGIQTALVEYLQLPAKARKDTARQLRQYVVENYSSQEMTRQTIEIYARVLRKRAGR